jgi:hypothetical protein
MDESLKPAKESVPKPAKQRSLKLICRMEEIESLPLLHQRALLMT